MKKVAVIVESSTEYGRRLLSGIAKYGRLHGWQVSYEQGGMRRDEPEWLAHWDGDGVITRCPTPTHSLALAQRGIVVLSNNKQLDQEGCYYHEPVENGLAVGKLAAEYFIKKGYKNFAFAGFNDINYSSERERGFTQAIEEAGYSCTSFLLSERGRRGTSATQDQQAFLRSLPQPCALLTANDERGAQILASCMECGIAVPEEIAVLGVDNDPLLCDLAYPPLSSISPNVPRMGWELAHHLDVIMEGSGENTVTEIPPDRLVERQSTALNAVEDEVLAKALHLIHVNHMTGMNVSQLAIQVGVSRRTLERKFSQTLHTTIKDYAQKIVVERIKSLLIETDYTIEHIASIVGIEYMQRLYQVFKKYTNQTPAEYREKHHELDAFS